VPGDPGQEGRLDDQTLTGKAIAELARRCRASGRPLYVVAGSRTLGDDDVAALGLAGVREATTLEELREAGRAVAAAMKVGIGLAMAAWVLFAAMI